MFKPKKKQEEEQDDPSRLPDLPELNTPPAIKKAISPPIEEVKKVKWIVDRVPSEYGLVIINQEEEKSYDVLSALVEILNTLEEFKEEIK